MKDYERIRYMYLVDGISQRKIARSLGISRNTVAKYCEGKTYPGIRSDYNRANSVMTPKVVQFIRMCLHEDELEPNKKQHHTAKRIYDRLVEEAGFDGAETTVRGLVHKLRGNLSETFVPLAFDPGEAMQIDWGECYIQLRGERMKINIFCARLCYSCAPFAICFRQQNTEAFLEGLQRALEFFGGVPRRIIFDNARVAVKFGSGKNAICQDSYEAMAAHYCFKTIFCNVRSGNEKGLVENLVGSTRRNIFVPVPHTESLAELNEKVSQRCQQYIDSHKIQGKPFPVSTMFGTDQRSLLALPRRPFDVSQAMEARVSAYATIRFATNVYSVPVKYTGQTVAIRAYAENIKIYANGRMIAVHERCYDHSQKILRLDHYLPLLERKPRSILQAIPVRQSLSSAMFHLLQTTDFTEKELVDILNFCVKNGEDSFWQHLPEFLTSHAAPPKIKDTVSVQTVDLTAYDQFLQKGDACPCRIQA